MKGGNKARGKQQTGLAPRMASISHEGTSLCGAVGLGLGLKGLLLEAAWGPAATSRPCVAAPLAAAPFHLRRRCVSSIVSHGCVGDTSWSGRSLPRIHRCCPDGRPMRVAKQRRGWRQHHLCHHVHIPTSESMAEQGESRRRDSTIVRRPGVVLPIAVYLAIQDSETHLVCMQLLPFNSAHRICKAWTQPT